MKKMIMLSIAALVFGSPFAVAHAQQSVSLTWEQRDRAIAILEDHAASNPQFTEMIERAIIQLRALAPVQNRMYLMRRSLPRSVVPVSARRPVRRVL